MIRRGRLERRAGFDDWHPPVAAAGATTYKQMGPRLSANLVRRFYCS
jgi:hypothetical protein